MADSSNEDLTSFFDACIANMPIYRKLSKILNFVIILKFQFKSSNVFPQIFLTYFWLGQSYSLPELFRSFNFSGDTTAQMDYLYLISRVSDRFMPVSGHLFFNQNEVFMTNIGTGRPPFLNFKNDSSIAFILLHRPSDSLHAHALFESLYKWARKWIFEGKIDFCDAEIRSVLTIKTLLASLLSDRFEWNK